jgi:hypothetical protein
MIARHVPTAARILMGLVFFVFGLDGFLHFIPVPSTPPPEGAMAFGGALMQTGYMLPLIKGTEVLVGALLLSNRLVPLALALIAPVVVNILAFALFLAPSGLPIPLAIVALEIYLAWSYRKAYRPMLALRATPTWSAEGGKRGG